MESCCRDEVLAVGWGTGLMENLALSCFSDYRISIVLALFSFPVYPRVRTPRDSKDCVDKLYDDVARDWGGEEEELAEVASGELIYSLLREPNQFMAPVLERQPDSVDLLASLAAL